MIPVAMAVAAALLLAAAETDPPPDPQVAGERVYLKCYACHSLRPEVTLTGPSLNGVIGGKVAAQPGFAYSPAMRAFAANNPVWTAELLESYLADPVAKVPTTTMGFPGIKDAAERSELIAYLRKFSGPAR